MKMFHLLLLSALLSPAPILAQEDKAGSTNAPIRISAAEAKDHIKSEAIVTGKIVEVSKAEKLVRLNFDKPFPKQPFTAIIFADKTNLFPDLDALKNKKVEVRGEITEYRERPQIRLISTNQLKVLETAAP